MSCAHGCSHDYDGPPAQRWHAESVRANARAGARAGARARTALAIALARTGFAVHADNFGSDLASWGRGRVKFRIRVRIRFAFRVRMRVRFTVRVSQPKAGT